MKHARSIGGALGVVIACLDLLIARAFGLEMTVGDWDASLPVLAYLVASFSGLGFLIGLVLEHRAKDRATASLIAEQHTRLEETRARLAQAEKLAALGQLSSTIAHEVRNPLAIIRSTVQNLAEAEPSVASTSAAVIEEIDRLSQVTSRLLGYARPPRLVPTPVDVHALLRRVQSLESQLPHRGAVALAAGTSLPTVPADEELLCQVLLGLIENARDAAGTEGRVRLEAGRAEDAVVIAVEDSGPGFGEDGPDRALEPFYTTKPEGTGLGLAVARSIVEAHGGRLELSRSPLGGARVALFLPTPEAA